MGNYAGTKREGSGKRLPNQEHISGEVYRKLGIRVLENHFK